MLVYLVTNLIDGKRYIGQTIRSLGARWWQHCNKNYTGCHYLHRAVKKYGKENFFVEVLCEPPTEELLNEMETYFIDRYCTLAPNGYNLTTGGQSPRPSDITKQKMREAHLGKPCPWVSNRIWLPDSIEKAKLRMLGNKNLLGHSPSEETRRKISESMKKRRRSDFWSTAKTKSEFDRRQTYDAIRHRNKNLNAI
jgi:group I intron endonuclease